MKNNILAKKVNFTINIVLTLPVVLFVLIGIAQIEAMAYDPPLTIQQMVDQGAPYSTVTVPTGEYTEFGLRIDKPLTLVADGEVSISLGGNTIVVTANNVTIRGFAIKRGKPIMEANGVTNLTVEECKIECGSLMSSSLEDGICVYNFPGGGVVNIRNNLIYGLEHDGQNSGGYNTNAYDGIYVHGTYGASGVSIENNTIYGFGSYNLYIHGAGAVVRYNILQDFGTSEPGTYEYNVIGEEYLFPGGYGNEIVDRNFMDIDRFIFRSTVAYIDNFGEYVFNPNFLRLEDYADNPAYHVGGSNFIAGWPGGYDDSYVWGEINPPPPPTVDPVISPTNAVTQNITGTRSEDTVRIIINSSQATISNLSYPTTTTWSCTATLIEGYNDFTVVAEDAVGRQSPPVDFEIVLDTIPPTGTISINNGAAYTRFEAVTLNLSAQDNVGGAGVSKMQFSSDNINWLLPEPFAPARLWMLSSGDGEKRIYARFMDSVDNWSTAVSDSIILDTIPPEIIITSPQDGALVNTPILPVSYTSDGVAKDKNVSLAEGVNTVTVEDSDEAGNIGSASITVTLDTIPPEIIITSPKDGAVVVTPEVTLEGTVDGVFFSELRTLQVGPNTLTKQATDAAGNTAEASINICYHPPQTIGPEGGTVTSQSGRIAVEIPAGALGTYEEISAIDKYKSDFEGTQVPPDTEVAGVLQLLPTGLTFNIPVKLYIFSEEPLIPGTPVVIGLLNEPINTFEDTGLPGHVTTDPYTVTTEITHFSTYAALSSMISSGAPIGGGVQIPTPDLFTGAFTHDIGIEIPKGRKDMHPNLSLQYRSSNPNEWIGAGWQLNLGYIQRSTKKGVPAYNDSVDTFVYVTQSQSTELVHLVDNLYQAKVEGSFVQYYKQADDTWYLLTKDGGKMYFGQTISSKQTTASGTFAWYITEAIDTNGNYIEFNYTKDGGKVYLSQILYTGNYNTAVSPKYEVVFNLEDRTDINSSYISGEECTMSKRLHSIEVYCDLSLVWTYELVYIYSPDTARTLLSSVTQIGSDGTRFPAQTFEYQRK